MKANLFLGTLIIVSAVLTRILPHAWNFAPVTAIAIVAAMYLPLRSAIALPLLVRFVSDAIIGFFSLPLMIGVYAAHLFGVVMGLWVRKSVTSPQPSPSSERVAASWVRLGAWAKVFIAPTLSASVFFLITNFAFLYSAQEYSHDLPGIILAYTNGLPFLRGTLLGDVGYTLALVGAVEGVRAWQRRRQVIPVAS